MAISSSETIIFYLFTIYYINTFKPLDFNLPKFK